jgi:glycosyltransferase involved in cell wall biosynthesis
VRVEDVVAEIDRAHVGLMCSRSEAFGRVTVEYLRRGRPVIGTRSGGTPELTEDGVTGLLYDPGDIEALADHIERVAASNAMLVKLSLAALESNADRFVISDYVSRFHALLLRARDGARPGRRSFWARVTAALGR